MTISPKPPENLEELKNFVTILKPKIGRFGGRFFEDRSGHQFRLNTIVGIFEKAFFRKNPLTNDDLDNATQILAAISRLDIDANLKLEHSFLKRMLTKIRQIFNFTFDRESRLARISDKLNQTFVSAENSEDSDADIDDKPIQRGDYARFFAQSKLESETSETDYESPPSRSQSESVSSDHERYASFSESESHDTESSSDSESESVSSDHQRYASFSDSESESRHSDYESNLSSSRSASVSSAHGYESFSDSDVAAPVEAEREAFIEQQLIASNNSEANLIQSNSPRAVSSTHLFDSKIGEFENVGYFYENLQFLKDLNEEEATSFRVRNGKLEKGIPDVANAAELIDTLKEMSVQAAAEADHIIEGQANRYQAAGQLEAALTNEFDILRGIEILTAQDNTAFTGNPELLTIANRAKDKIRQHDTHLRNLLKSIEQNEHLAAAQAVNEDDDQIDEARSDLAAFCRLWCTGVTAERAREMIRDGRALYRNIIEGRAEKGSEADLLNLTWFLMSKAIDNEQGYEEGTFVVEDPDKRLYRFLLASNGEGGNGIYARPSTHYVGRSPKLHKGIDIFKTEMPARKRTLLFEMVKNYGSDQEVLFIKPENYSAKLNYFIEALYHGGEMVIAQRNKFLYPGTDDLENMRKERVPTEVINQFTRLLKSVPNIDQKAIMADAKKYGIAYMNAFVNEIKKQPPANFNPRAFEDLIGGYDHLEARTGREVYLSYNELL